VKRREFTKPQKAEMMRRSMDPQGRIRCEGCGCDLTGKALEFDHTIAEALVIDKTRKLTAADGQLLGKNCCHRGPDGKTAQDVAAIAEAKRREAAHGGFASTRPSGFPPPLRRGRATAPLTKTLPPRRWG
jgi:hypothetical protein